MCFKSIFIGKFFRKVFHNLGKTESWNWMRIFIKISGKASGFAKAMPRQVDPAGLVEVKNAIAS